MSRKKNFTLILLIVLVGIGTGFFVWRKTALQKDNRSYIPITVNKGDLLIVVQSNGTVQPENRLVIKPPINGRIDQIFVKEGDAVKKGHVLAKMSSTDRAALLDVARGKGPEEVRHWEEIYRPTPIIAPLSGVIISRSVEPGQAVSTNDPVYSMSDRLIVNAQVDETDMAKVKVGQAVKVTLDAYSTEPFTGKVHQIAFDARSVNNVTVYDVRILPEIIPEFMRSGMTASVQFMIEEHKDVNLVPDAAIIRADGTTYVLQRKGIGREAEDQPPQRVQVKVGRTDGKSVEVLEGLAAGDQIFQEVFKLPEAKSEGSPFSPMRQGKSPTRGGGGR